MVEFMTMSTETIHTDPAILRAERLNTGVALDKNNPTALALQKEVEQSNGRIPYSKFMEICLYGEDGFYSSGKVEIGPEKDFITAPEETTMVGATIAETLKDVWLSSGEPEHFDIIEMGAGKAGLAHTILKWTQEKYPAFHSAINYTILEYGLLIQKQKARLAEFEHKVDWVQGSALAIPFKDVHGVFLSNELVDAFPAERVLRINGQIKQKYIRLVNDVWTETWEEPTNEVLGYIHRNSLHVVEEREEPINLYAEPFQKSLDAALKRGAILTIDYGQEGAVGYKNIVATRFYGIPNKEGSVKNLGSVYKNMGNVDITTNVNFSPLNRIAQADGLYIMGGPMDTFLAQFGANRVTEDFKKLMETTNSWKTLLEIVKNVESYRKLLKKEILKKFYVQLATKGITIPIKSKGAELSEPGYPTIHVPVGAKNRKVQVTHKVKVRGKEKLTTAKEFTSDDNGHLSVPPGSLEGLVITDSETQEVLYDFSDPSLVKEVIEELGCKYDV